MIHYILCVCVKSNGEEKYGTNCVKMVYFIDVWCFTYYWYVIKCRFSVLLV